MSEIDAPAQQTPAKLKKAWKRAEQRAAWRSYCEACARISFPDFLRDVWPHCRRA